jgi:hypothetical protein
MSLETMTKLATTTVGVSAQSSISFTNIPQGYTDLVIKVSGRTAASQGISLLSFNSVDTGLSSRIIYSIGSGGPASATYSSSIRGGYIVGTDYTASVFANNEIYISNYSSNTFKSVSVDSVTENNATEAYSQIVAGLWANSSPITSLTFTVLNNGTGVPSTFTQHSTFTLYGIKNAIKTAGNSIKATGGDIIFDGTYVYHVFDSSGTFAPTQPILADALVVAGGGGAGYYFGGGGGAGGIQYATSQSLITTGYTVTVGAGGASKVVGSAGIGATGGDSSFSSLVIAKGGGAGNGSVTGSAVGGAGGSGGGAGGPDAGSAGGAAVAGTGGTFYGNAGGPTPGGGSGGGSGAAGTSKGKGGNGTTAFSSWGIATGTGQNVGGVFYYAGGGESNQQAGGGGFGGGGAWLTSGTPNTGGGAGADQGAGGGGSGLVIIRYKG